MVPLAVARRAVSGASEQAWDHCQRLISFLVRRSLRTLHTELIKMISALLSPCACKPTTLTVLLVSALWLSPITRSLSTARQRLMQDRTWFSVRTWHLFNSRVLLSTRPQV